MKRPVIILSLLVLFGVFCWLFPLFHIVRHGQTAEATAEAFDAAAFAETFWNNRLQPALAQAYDAAAVLAALRENPEAARQQFGRTVGMSRNWYVVVQGKGIISSVDAKGVQISLESAPFTPAVQIAIGPLFGNAVRDVTGLASASDFANSQDFNNLSAELNRIVETRVFPELKRQAAVGRSIQFVGCAEIGAQSNKVVPLKIVPLKVRIE